MGKKIVHCDGKTLTILRPDARRIPTLEGTFAGLRELEIVFNENDILEPSFEFAYWVARRKAIDTAKPESKGFIDYLVRIRASSILNAARRRLFETEDKKTLKYIKPTPEEIKNAAEVYHLNPLNQDVYRDFRRAKKMHLL